MNEVLLPVGGDAFGRDGASLGVAREDAQGAVAFDGVIHEFRAGQRRMRRTS